VKLKKFMEQEPAVGKLPVHGLWKILLSALSTVPKVYILLDALDELAVEEDGFLQCLLELGQKMPSSIKLILTSRPQPHLQTVLKGSFLANLRLTGRMVEKDIATYITHRMANQRERILTAEEQLLIQDVLCKKGQGLFLYARLMLDEMLQQSISVHELLQHLPTSLEDMYVDLLHEHSSRSGASLHFQSFLLSWVTHSSRPLRITELAALINSDGGRGGLKDHQDAKLMVRTSCGPLLEILDDETIQVIHHSFTEFLLDSSRKRAKETTGSGKWFPTFTPALVHRSLTLSCIDYLLSGCFKSWSVDERPTTIDSRMLEQQRRLMVRSQFLQYAAQNLLYHTAKHDALDADLISKFDRFFQYGSHDFESWKDFMFAKNDKNTRFTPDCFYPLHIAAQAGLTAYIVYMFGKGEDPDLVDDHSRTAIAHAAMRGHAKTVAAFLDQKASFTINDNDGLQPIHHAAKGNHVKVLRHLLDAGADPMALKAREYKDYYSWDPSTVGKTPMQYACERGNLDVVSELLQRLGSDLISSVLPHWASAKGQAKVLSILLRHPEILANINKKDICGNTALYLGASVKDSATVRILLHYGADVHTKSDDLVNSMDERISSKPVSIGHGRTALQGWAKSWHRGRNADQGTVEEWETTGKLLMEAGSDVEARDETGRTVLFDWTEQLIADRGDTTRMDRFVSLLLEYGANPNATDNAGNTALHQHRMWNQYPEVIRLLTSAGADINRARDGDLVTPLISAAKAQCVDCKAYVENGANPNMQDSDGNTAFHHVSRSWSFEFEHVQEWLRFADPTIKNNKGETCLYNLRFGNWGYGRVKAIPLFVEKGVDLESRNRLGRTALLAACQNAQPHFITGLVQNGANARSKDFQNKSCKDV
jgi:ankyrin repeat protein